MDNPITLRSVVTLPSTATVEEMKQVTDRDGAVIVEGLFEPEFLGRLNGELNVWLDKKVAADNYTDDEWALKANGLRTKRIMHLAARSDGAVEAMLSPKLLGWAEACLASDPEFGSIQLHTGTVIEIAPGEPAQFIYSDETDMPSMVTGPVGPDRPELVVGCMCALTDFTEENGATRVIPGSHLIPIDWANFKSDTVAAEMKAGSVLFYTGKVAHGGGANKSDHLRRGMTILFSQGWLKPIEASCISLSLDRARQLPRRMQELLGFSSVYRPLHAGGKPRLLLWQSDAGEARTLLDNGPVR